MCFRNIKKFIRRVIFKKNDILFCGQKVLSDKERIAMEKKYCRKIFNNPFYLPKRVEAVIYSFMLLVGLAGTSFFVTGITIAYFGDKEVSKGNLFSAGDLDYSVDFVRSDGFRTETQENWGKTAAEGEAGAYRYENFSSAFPEGVLIGKEGGWFSARFSSSESVMNFLPSSGPSSKFTQNHIDPTHTEAGVLAGNTLALSLNVEFDDYDPDFSKNETRLGDFYANSDLTMCMDMTVSEVLDSANVILSGGEIDLSPREVNECVDEINKSFVGGEPKKLSLGDTVWRKLNIKNESESEFQYNIGLEQVSGDPDFCLYLHTDVYLEEDLVYSGEMFSFISGVHTFSSSTDNWEFRNIGMVGDPPYALQEKTCGYRYIVNGWQVNFTGPTEGFYDIEFINDTLYSGTWAPPISASPLLSSIFADIRANIFSGRGMIEEPDGAGASGVFGIDDRLSEFVEPETTTTTSDITTPVTSTIPVVETLDETSTTTIDIPEPETEEEEVEESLPTTTSTPATTTPIIITPEVLETIIEFILPATEEPLPTSTTSTEFTTSTE